MKHFGSARNLLINFLLSLLVFVLCLALTEAYFRARARQGLPTYREPVYRHNINESQIPTRKIPQDIVEKINREFPNPTIDQKTFDILNPLRSEMELIENSGGVPHKTIVHDRNSGPAHFHVAYKLRGRQIINSTYNIDEHHIRISSNRPYSPNKKNFVLLGCSYAFGQSVNDDQTMTAFLARENPEYNYYNLGVPGGGLTEILDDIHFKDRLQVLNRQGGAVVYLYFFDHFRRDFGDFDYQGKRQYEVRSGELVLSDRYEGLGRIKFELFRFLGQSEFLKYTGWVYNPYQHDLQERFVDYLAYVRDFYKREFNLDFHLFILDPYDVPSLDFLQMLKERNIKYVIYESKMTVFPRNLTTIPADQHFTPAGNKMFALLMKDYLKQEGFFQ